MSRRRGVYGDKKETVAVAIDKDKGSQYALKWAIEQILSKGQSVTLLHVKQNASSIPTPCKLLFSPSPSPSFLIFSHDTLYVSSSSFYLWTFVFKKINAITLENH